MALDLQLIQFSPSGVISCAIWPTPSYVGGDVGFVQVLYKCLLTTPGQDAYDPEWGAGLADTLLEIPGNDTAAATTAANHALLKALRDLQGQYPLIRLTATNVEYDVSRTAWQVDILMETTEGTVELSLPIR